jgi:hypothetical protein
LIIDEKKNTQRRIQGKIVIELLHGEKELNVIASENEIAPN